MQNPFEMRTPLNIITILFALLPGVYAQTKQAADAGQNLVRNHGFEKKGPVLPDDWIGDKNIFSMDKTVFKKGSASLKYSNNNPGLYKLANQAIVLVPGQKYEFSAWIKTGGIKGKDSGATICVEWSGKNGKWLGGSYPQGVKGTSNWRLIKGNTGRIPKEARTFTISCYVRKGMTGTAWFDDVFIRRVIEPPLYTILTSPVYRGRFSAGRSYTITARVFLNMEDYNLSEKDVSLTCELFSGGEKPGKILKKIVTGPPLKKEMTTSIQAPSLPVGKYTLQIKLLRGTKILATCRHTLLCIKKEDRQPVFIDDERRTILNGKPFFPLGMYFSSINKKDLAIYSKSSFNCLMPYGRVTRPQMDLAESYGLKVIYSIKDFYAGSSYCPKTIQTEAGEEKAVREKIKEFKNHPALLAWYLNDELPLSYLPRLEAHYNWAKKDDPGHPTWVVLYQVSNIRKYITSFDVIGSDPYPIPSAASRAWDWATTTEAEVAGGRAIWMVPQVFNWAAYKKTGEEKKKYRSPTAEAKLFSHSPG